MHNTPTVVECDKGTHMSHQGEAKRECKFCGESDGATHVAILKKGAELSDDSEPKEFLWLCENHFKALSESREYRVRELPEVEGELAHSSREEISEDGEDYITILEPENENKWLKVPDTLETELKEER